MYTGVTSGQHERGHIIFVYIYYLFDRSIGQRGQNHGTFLRMIHMAARLLLLPSWCSKDVALTRRQWVGKKRGIPSD